MVTTLAEMHELAAKVVRIIRKERREIAEARLTESVFRESVRETAIVRLRSTIAFVEGKKARLHRTGKTALVDLLQREIDSLTGGEYARTV